MDREHQVLIQLMNQLYSALPEYSGSGTHKLIHQDLLKRFGEHVLRFRSSPEMKVSNDFFMFLKVWLSAHICGIDRKYADVAQVKTG